MKINLSKSQSLKLLVAVLFFCFTKNSHALDIYISPGESIQNAIDLVVASGGGTVQLEAGVYIIDASIEMSSNVTLQGVGIETRIELPLEATYPMIIDDGTEPCVNMTVRNLLLDGNIPESKVSHDPEYTTDPQNPCLGILFDASREETYHTNVIIENVEIHNTVDGCHIKGIKGGYMNNVFMHHNGIFFWPGHNAYLRRCIDYTVKNSRFEDSYNGSGVNCSWSKNLLFSNCVIARSNGRGIRNAASDGFVVHDCIIVDCASQGLIANAEQGITTSNCDFRRNCISGNATGMTGGSTGAAYDNRVFNNDDNIDLGSEIIQAGNTTTSGESCALNLADWNPVSVAALVLNENPKQISLKISHTIASNTTYEGFTVKVDDAQATIESITLLNSTEFVINLLEGITEDNMVTLSYSETGNVERDNGIALSAFENVSVTNTTGSVIEVESKSIDVSGLFVTFNLSREIGTIQNQSENFTFNINGEIVTATEAVIIDNSIRVYPYSKIYAEDEVKVSFNPGEYRPLIAINTSELQAFTNVELVNTSELSLSTIPGKIEAEDYDYQLGLSLENCSEGGQNIAYIDDEDWAEYNVQSTLDTTYKATFRVASPNGGGTITVYVDGKTKGIVTVPNTGGWQTYQSIGADMKITSGLHTIKTVFSGGFNVNWIQFTETEPGNEGVFFDRIEAEDYNGNIGGSVENSSDTDGGENVGSMRNGNWLMFSDLDVSNAGGIEVRLAHNAAGSSVEIRTGSATGTLLGTVTIPNTGGFQTWETASIDLESVDGVYDVYFVFKNSGGWAGNFNWFKFIPSKLSNDEIFNNSTILLYPNPTKSYLVIEGHKNSKMEIYNVLGAKVFEEIIQSDQHTISTEELEKGMYMVNIYHNGFVKTSKLIKE